MRIFDVLNIFHSFFGSFCCEFFVDTRAVLNAFNDFFKNQNFICSQTWNEIAPPYGIYLLKKQCWTLWNQQRPPCLVWNKFWLLSFCSMSLLKEENEMFFYKLKVKHISSIYSQPNLLLSLVFVQKCVLNFVWWYLRKYWFSWLQIETYRYGRWNFLC